MIPPVINKRILLAFNKNCTLLLIVVILVTSTIFGIDNETVNDSAYTPKSKRSKVLLWMKNVHCKISRTIIPWYDKLVPPWYDILKNKTEIFFKTKTKQRKLFQEIKHSSYENKSRYKNNHMNRVMAMSVVAMSIKGTGAYENNAHFDTDSTMVGVDNRCSACISSDIKDFDGPVMDTNRTIKGFAGSKVRNVKTGTIA